MAVQDVKDMARSRDTKTSSGYSGTTYGAGTTSLDNYNFREGVIELRERVSEVCDSKTFVVVEVSNCIRTLRHKYFTCPLFGVYCLQYYKQKSKSTPYLGNFSLVKVF